MLDRGRVWRPLDGQTDPCWRRSFGDAARPLVPRYLRRGVDRAAARRRQRPPAARRGAGARPARGARALRRRGRRDLPAQRLRQPGARAAAARARPRGRSATSRRLDLVGDVAAREGVRARVDDGRRRLHEADLHRLRARPRRAPARGGLRGRAELRRLRGDAAALGRGAREAVPDRLRRAGRRDDLEPRASARRSASATSSAATSAAPRPTSRSSSTAQPFVNNTFELEHDLIINALSTEISSVGAGGGSIVSISPSGDVLVGPGSAGSDPGPACYGRGGTQPTVTDACLLMGILDPDGFAGGELRLDAELARRGVRVARDAAAARAADRLRVPDRGREHRRGGDERRRPPRRRPARLHARRLRRRGPDAAAGGARPAARAPRGRPAAPRATSRRSGCSAPTSSTTTAAAPTSCSSPTRRRRSTAVFEEMERGLRERAGRRRRGRAAQLRRAPVRARAGRRRSSRCRTGRSRRDDPALIERFHDDYERRYGNRFPYIPVQGVSYRVELHRPLGEGRVRRRGSGRAASRAPGPHDRAPPLRRRAARRRWSTTAASSAGRRADRRARRSSARRSRRRSSSPGQIAEVGALRRDRDRAAA